MNEEEIEQESELLQNDLYTNFIPDEVKYIRAMEKNEKLMKEMELNPKEFKSELRLVEDYNNWLGKMLKYENLRIEDVELYKPYKRLVRLHTRIPIKWLDKKNYEYVRMGGLYLVRTVYFFEPEKIEKWMKKPTKYNNENLELPDNYILSTAKLIRSNNGIKHGVCLTIEGDDDEIYYRYLQGQRYSVWSYPVI